MVGAPTPSAEEALIIGARDDRVTATQLELRTPTRSGRAVVVLFVLDDRRSIDFTPVFDMHDPERPRLEPPWEVALTDCRLPDWSATDCESRAFRRDAFD